MSNAIPGNIQDVAAKHKGWFMGWFVDKPSEFKSTDFEIKWSNHKKGEGKSVAVNHKSKTLCILLSGKEKFNFGPKEIVLDKEGQFVYWPENTPHTWKAIKDSKTITIRWPSIPNDQASLS